MTDTTFVYRHPAAAWQHVGGEVVVVHAANERILGLNPSAGFVWDRLDGTASLGHIAQDLAERWNITLEQAGQDVRALVTELISRGLAMVKEITP